MSAVADAVAEVYGRQAMVRLSGHTLFLSQCGKGWKVVAAGCTPRPDRPFDCQVERGAEVRVLFVTVLAVIVLGLAYFTTIGLLQR
ncbi:hypothetical protein [Streptomyces virginiae]|uniref:hypothetical protein n=1 Tax=Streptomyces virginiae TaxID=1961 RepID=UPI003453BADE